MLESTEIDDVQINTTCISQETLEDYIRHELSQHVELEVEAHLAHCSECFEKLLTLGPYPLAGAPVNVHIVRRIGQGRFGVVYKAWWTRNKPRLIALKVLHSVSDEDIQRFDREVAVLKRINSPGIIKCHASGTMSEGSYYIMDYVCGVPLDEYLAGCGDNLGPKLEVFQKVCLALADAHEAGVIHRDLKPNNILVDAQGQPFVLDFGICGLLEAQWGSRSQWTLTQSGQLIGSLQYMSPEQAWGGAVGPIDQRSDIWSLGVMLYEITTHGDYPFSMAATADESAPEALLQRIRREMPRRPKLDHLPDGQSLETLLERSLAWETSDRLSSARELGEEIGRYTQGYKLNLRRTPLGQRIRRVLIGAAIGSRWELAILWVGVTLAGLYLSTVFFNVGWYPTSDSSLWSGIAPPNHNVKNEFVIVGLFDDSTPSMKAFAEKHQLGTITDLSTSWRPLYAYFMKRLTKSRPRVVTWDFYFTSQQRADPNLAGAIRQLEQAGVPVVLASANYDTQGTPQLSSELVKNIGWPFRYGLISVLNPVQRPGTFILAIRRCDDCEIGSGCAIPSLILSAAAAVHRPQNTLDLDWCGRSSQLELAYRMEAPQAYIAQRDHVQATFIHRYDDLPAPGVLPGDLIAIASFPLHRPKEWASQIVRFEELLNDDMESLKEKTQGKIMIVGDFRLGTDRRPVKYGSEIVPDVPGCLLIADGIVGLLNGKIRRSAFPLSPVTLLLLTFFSVVAYLIPMKLVQKPVFLRRPLQKVVLFLLAVACVLSFSSMVRTSSFLLVHAGMTGVAMSLPMAASFGVEFVRNRHRVGNVG